jgi:hypothetical protein
LDYRNRRLSLEKKNILTFIRMLSDGRFLIPSFQRYFVWDPEHILNLWESIYEGYPIGSILYWKTAARLKIHRRLGGFYIPQGKEDSTLHSYILDGQQRATSLLISFYGGTGQIKDHANFNYSLYFDLTKRNFFFENELYRRHWDTPDNFLIRVRDVPDIMEYFHKQLIITPGYNRKIGANLKQLRSIFTDYEIPLIHLKGFNIAAVCDVYERINQSGMKLENMDIMIARNFHDNPTIIEEDFT